MKPIYIAIMAMLCCACNRKAIMQQTTVHQSNYTDSRGNTQLLGMHTKKDLQQAPFASWFNKNYDDYRMDSATAHQLQPFVKDKQFEIFMGTWCGDSKREVPRMFKLLEYAGVQPSQIKMVMVDNRDSVYKQSPGHEEKGKGIHRVPDLLVYDKGKEMNRIIESPVVSLEQDLLAIVKEESYQPNYKGAAWLAKMASGNNTAALVKDSTLLMATLKPMLQHDAELNTLGYVWMAAGETDKAWLAFQLNISMFPNDPNVYDSMGEWWLKLNKKEIAKKYYQHVLELEPGRASAVKVLKELDADR